MHSLAELNLHINLDLTPAHERFSEIVNALINQTALVLDSCARRFSEKEKNLRFKRIQEMIRQKNRENQKKTTPSARRFSEIISKEGISEKIIPIFLLF